MWISPWAWMSEGNRWARRRFPQGRSGRADHGLPEPVVGVEAVRVFPGDLHDLARDQLEVLLHGRALAAVGVAEVAEEGVGLLLVGVDVGRAHRPMAKGRLRE